jgi:hypothetical protein
MTDTKHLLCTPRSSPWQAMLPDTDMLMRLKNIHTLIRTRNRPHNTGLLLLVRLFCLQSE